MKRIIFLLIIFVLASCRSLDERNKECIENMPVEVRAHVREFLEEGAKRGKKFKLKNLRIELVSYLPNNAAGVYIHDGHLIKLDTSGENWDMQNNNFPLISTETGRRFIIFHELGHAILKRDHTTNLSIMSYRRDKFYSNWDKLLDELFN